MALHISCIAQLDKRKSADALVVPFWQGEKKAVIAGAFKGLSARALVALEKGDFLGKEGEELLLYEEKGIEPRLLLLGLGRREESHAEGLRRAYGGIARSARRRKLTSLNLLFPEGVECPPPLTCEECACEGIFLSNYSFDLLKSETRKEADPLLSSLCLVGVGAKEGRAIERSEQLISSVHYARDLVNGNADEVTPERLAQMARELAKTHPSLKVRVLDKKQIEKEKMGLLLAVNRGSTREPALIVLEYRGQPSSKELTALVGKGITYDTGGLNLKPTGSMETMKADMAGAAAVLGTLRAAASLHLKVNLIGVIAATENAIGPDSYKPGDVYVSRSAKSVEIGNTDAEGRLVLADAISYVQDYFSPSRIIDLATLTGGIVVALGEEATGLFCNDDQLAKRLIGAGERTGERLWRMPLYPEYKETLKSSIADLKNTGSGRKASSGTAAMFLQQFVQKKVPWAHLDIAGTAFLSEPRLYHPTSATGVGVRLLLSLLAHE